MFATHNGLLYSAVIFWAKSVYEHFSAANLAKGNCGSLPAEMRENAGDCNFVGHAHNFVIMPNYQN